MATIQALAYRYYQLIVNTPTTTWRHYRNVQNQQKLMWTDWNGLIRSNMSPLSKFITLIIESRFLWLHLRENAWAYFYIQWVDPLYAFTHATWINYLTYQAFSPGVKLFLWIFFSIVTTWSGILEWTQLEIREIRCQITFNKY